MKRPLSLCSPLRKGLLADFGPYRNTSKKSLHTAQLFNKASFAWHWNLASAKAASVPAAAKNVAARSNLFTFFATHFPLFRELSRSATAGANLTKNVAGVKSAAHRLGNTGNAFSRSFFAGKPAGNWSTSGPVTTMIHARATQSAGFATAAASKPVFGKAGGAWKQKASQFSFTSEFSGKVVALNDDDEKNGNKENVQKSKKRTLTAQNEQSNKKSEKRCKTNQAIHKLAKTILKEKQARTSADLEIRYTDLSFLQPRITDDPSTQVYLSFLLYGPSAWDEAFRPSETLSSKPSSNPFEENGSVPLDEAFIRDFANVADVQQFHLEGVEMILRQISERTPPPTRSEVGDDEVYLKQDLFRVERHGCELKILFPRGCPLDRARRALVALGIEPDSPHFLLESEDIGEMDGGFVWRSVGAGGGPVDDAGVLTPPLHPLLNNTSGCLFDRNEASPFVEEGNHPSALSFEPHDVQNETLAFPKELEGHNFAVTRATADSFEETEDAYYRELQTFIHYVDGVRNIAFP